LALGHLLFASLPSPSLDHLADHQRQDGQRGDGVGGDPSPRTSTLTIETQESRGASEVHELGLFTTDDMLRRFDRLGW
jgi:hypothetical protein